MWRWRWRQAQVLLLPTWTAWPFTAGQVSVSVMSNRQRHRPNQKRTAVVERHWDAPKYWWLMKSQCCIDSNLSWLTKCYKPSKKTHCHLVGYSYWSPEIFSVAADWWSPMRATAINLPLWRKFGWMQIFKFAIYLSSTGKKLTKQRWQVTPIMVWI